MADFTVIDTQLGQWLDSRRTEIIGAAQALIAIPSVKGDSAPGAPYGTATRAALENVLAICERYGFATKMLDGYAAHAEFGSGDEMIGILSHVDVVPAGSDWRHDPWGGVIEDGRIYGRGAIDDKGPTIAALYAEIAIKELKLPITRRIRHILGADEESGFGCMHHYFEVAREEMPTVGFTPDGRFPAIYAEKGIATPTLTATVQNLGMLSLIDFSAGQRSNMVPDRAQIVIEGPPAELEDIAGVLAGIPNVTAQRSASRLSVSATGVGAHGSLPHEGVNAVGILCGALLKARQFAETAWNPLLETLRLYAVDNTGACLDIAGSDEPSGDLTINLGILTLNRQNGTISATFSVRYPVSWAEADVKNRIAAAAKRQAFALTDWHHQGPLYVSQDSPFLSVLLDVYRAETGDRQPPQSMGGGTYARVLKHGVAYGPNFPGFPDNAHQADEYWTIEDLMKAARIYAKALIRLAA